MTDQIVERASGSPLLLRRLAALVGGAWRERQRWPAGFELPSFRAPSGTIEQWEWDRLSALEREVIGLIDTVGRPALVAEIAVALERSKPEVNAAFDTLVAADLLLREQDDLRARRSARFWRRLSPPREYLETVWTSEASERVHRRLADYWRQHAERPRERTALARHLLASGDVAAAQEAARAAAAALRSAGAFEQARRLLEDVIAAGESLRASIPLLEPWFAIVEQIEDHTGAVAFLEPIYERRAELQGREQLRLGRMLGIHYHRSGDADSAQRVFGEVSAHLDAEGGADDLVYIDAELAELYTFLGRYDEAETATRRGLKRLAELPPGAPFSERMRITLHASLGHLELRRMHLESARDELLKALRLSRRAGVVSAREAILNNLGVAVNQLGDVRGATRYFLQAERLLLAAGERRGVIKIACNLAVIAAKRGSRREALRQLERASRLVKYYGGERLVFFVAYTSGVVRHTLGDAREAIDSFETALPLGRRLGDTHLVRFAEIYLGEAFLAAADYARAHRVLTSCASSSESAGEALPARMALSRLYALERLLGRQRRSIEVRKRYRSIAPAPVLLLEAWNSVAFAIGEMLAPECDDSIGTTLSSARAVFRRHSVPFGVRVVRVLERWRALRSGDDGRLRRARVQLVPGDASGHAVLAIVEPLLQANVALALGEVSDARDVLQRR